MSAAPGLCLEPAGTTTGSLPVGSVEMTYLYKVSRWVTRVLVARKIATGDTICFQDKDVVFRGRHDLPARVRQVRAGLASCLPVDFMREILVVDLDHTLLKSDMLFESFWSAFGQDWRIPFRSVAALLQGRAALKRALAEAAHVDVTTLPYDAGVIAYIEAWREAGGRTALVTACDDTIAQEIGAHLKLFDEVHGSNGTDNLKGERKAHFLIETYGEKQFSYMGDATADLAVWRHAKQAITVNASGTLRARAAKLVGQVEHLDTSGPAPGAYLKAVRPHQWMKNVLVFVPMLAAHQTDGATILFSVLAFIAFSLMASSAYVLNDLLDLNADRAHPRKHLRPFAAGSVPIRSGTWMTLGLLTAGVMVSLVSGPAFLGVMVGYYILTIAYSLNLKRRVIVDICVLAGLYTMRIIAGGVAAGLFPTAWLLAFSIFFFLSLAAVKRQAELVDNARLGKLKVTGRGYHVDDLPIISMISISAGYAAVMVMAFYVNSPAVMALYATPEALWGVCVILLYWITRTVFIAHRGEMHDDPVIYASRDRISQICFVLVVLFVIFGALP